MKKARKIPYFVYSIFLIATFFFVDYYASVTHKLAKLYPIKLFQTIHSFTAPIGGLLNQVEYQVYDNYIFNKVASGQHYQINSLAKQLEKNDFEVGSPEYAQVLDQLIVNNPTSRDIVVAAIDEKTLTKLNTWPIRRDFYATFLERLFEKGKARAVAFDIVFSEEGDLSAIEALQQVAQKVPPVLQEEIYSAAERVNYNKRLEDAFKKYRSNIVSGFTLLSKEEVALKDMSNVFFPWESRSYHLDTQRGVEEQVMRSYGGAYNYAALRDVTVHNAFFNVTPDVDGIVRRLPLFNSIPIKFNEPKTGFISEEERQRWLAEYQSERLELFAGLGLEALNLYYGRSLGAPVPVGSYLEMNAASAYYSLNGSATAKLKSQIRDILLTSPDLDSNEKDLLKVVSEVFRLQMRPGFGGLEAFLMLNLIGEHKDIEAALVSMEQLEKPFLLALLKDLPKEVQQKIVLPVSLKNLVNFKDVLMPVHQNLTTSLIELMAEGIWYCLSQHLILLHSFSREKLDQIQAHFLTEYKKQIEITRQIFVEKNLEKPHFKVKMERDSKIGIVFNSARQGYVQYSMIDIMQNDKLSGLMLGHQTPEVDIEDAFRDRIVILGPTALGINDWRATPVTSYMDGLEIHAHTLDCVRNNTQIVRYEGSKTIEFVLLIFLAILLPKIITRLNAALGALLTMSLAIAWIGMCYYQIEFNFLYFQVVPISAYILGVYVFFTTYEYIVEEKEKKKTRDAFQHYVNASVVDSVLADPDMLKLGGQKRDMTVLFSDVRGFTTISEKLDATTLVALMNDYLEEMTNLVLESDGTLDKFIGDAVMAFWGAPLKQEDHAARATLTAIAMLKRMDTLAVEIKEKYDVEVAIGIGLNTGPMVVGNMGSKQRFNYTVLGDAVNLGARLEGQTKGYGAYLILSESTYNLVKDWAAGRLLDLIAVKGKTLPVKIFEVIGIKKEMSAEALRGLEEFEAAVHTYYFGRRFQEGIQVFKDLKKYRKGKDKACDLYIERCEDFSENPPPDNWDGSYVATSK